MRIALKWALPLLILAMLFYLIKGFTNTLSHKQKTAKRIQTLPAFTAYGLDSSAIDITALANHPIVFVYFDPDCDHCQREAHELRQKAALLNKAHVLMLSAAPVSDLKNFTQTYQLTKLPNVQVAHIDRKVAYETFGFSSVPDVLIYRANGSLVKHFRGKTGIEAIAKYF